MYDSLLNRMDRRQFVSFILLGEILTGLVNGKVSMTPTNAEVLAEDKLVLTCTSAGKQSVVWRHLPTAATTLRDVYVNGTIAEPYSDRLTVEKDEATGAYSLTAFRLSIEDSGKYFCREENGNGDDEKVAEIVVLASRPLCRIPVIPTQHDCQARSERSLRIDCSVEFSGNVRPIIECRNSERRILEREKISSSEISDSRVVLYSFISKVDFQTNKQTILCKTSVSHIPGNTMEIQIPSCESTAVPMGGRGGIGAAAHERRPSSPVNTVPMRNSRKVATIVICAVFGFVAVVCIGIAFACTYRLLLKSSDASPAIRFLWKLSTNHPIVQGVALLNGCLYVVHRGKKSVSVYEASSPCKYMGTIVLEGLQLPQDIASCARNSCVYVTDSGLGCVWKVEVQPKMESREIKISAWAAEVGDPHTIAVISGGRVLMAQKPNTLRIYRPDGTIFRSFEVRGNILEPQHAVRTSKGTFVISHGSKFDSEHRVCEVSAKGEILRQFGNKRGERDAPSFDDSSPTMTLRLSHPRHLAIDTSGRVLVTDRKNNRIIRLDKTMAMIETFPCPGADNTPVRLSCDAGRFLIGRGDSVYFYRIDDDDDDDDGKRRKDSTTKKNEDDDEDSDYYTDDVIVPRREAPERHLLSNLFPLQTHSSTNESSRLRQRNLKKPRD